MERFEQDVLTGEVKTVSLTQAEIDAALANKAVQDEYNSPDNVATRAADNADRLWFEVNFNQENRVRVLEGSPQITKAQYRDALFAAYRALLST